MSSARLPALREGLDIPARPEGPVAITSVTLVPMDRDAVIPDQTVVIEAGRIRSIGPAATCVVPPGARVVEGRGRYLMPGLADMHVHWWDLDEYRLYLANGVTTVRNMWGAPMHLALQRQIRNGLLPGPHLITTSPIVDGPGKSGRTIWSTSAMVARPEQAEPLVRAWAERGYPQIKVYSWLSPESHAALCVAAKTHGVMITGHCPDSISYEQAIANGHTCFEHLTGIRRDHLEAGVTMPDPSDRANRLALAKLAIEHLDWDSIRRLAVLMHEQQIWNCPTGVVWQQTTQRPAQARLDPYLRYMSPATRAAWDPSQDFRFRGQTFDDDYYDTLARLSEVYRRIVGVLHSEGAPLLLGTDTPNPYVIPGFSIHRELANLRAAGLSSYEALRCGTVEAARFVNETADWGTVEVGKRADLLLLPGNPVDDVAALREIAHVFVNGYDFARDALEARLADRARAVERPPVFETELDPPSDDATALRAGRLRDEVAGAVVAETSFRRSRTSRGELRVEERTASEQGQGGRMVRTTSLDLKADGTIVRGTQRMVSPLGEDTIEVRSAEGGDTIVEVQAIDGFQSTITLPGKVIATERVSVTALAAAVAASSGEASRQGLTLERGEPRSVSVVASRPPAGEAAGTAWRVAIDRVSELTEQDYRLGPDGTILEVLETSPRGQRRIAPVDGFGPG